MAIEAQENRYCESCKTETLHKAYEDALEIQFRCTECNETTQVFKTFF
ncbi:hypothetical protein GCM10008967_18250 [Bacillus carboniphilus]|uniref:Uncharacterized protein n=1 Tax=Bacillus carboniphilus TaxID=86663 RepID=A0ABP3FZT3_9BACI